MLYQWNILYSLIFPFQASLDQEQGWNPYETKNQTRVGTLNLDPELSWIWSNPALFTSNSRENLRDG